MKITAGLPPAAIPRAAELFWHAFEDKLGRLLGPEPRARAFLERVMVPRFALSAHEGETLLGIAGFKTEEGGLVGGTFRDLAAIYGTFGAIWRSPLLEMFERPLREGQLLMDGIFVAPEARGKGVGSALIQAVLAEAALRGCQEVRLDVIDTNTRAQALYLRQGFTAEGEVRTGLLRPLLGFRTATTMVARL